MGIKIKKLRAEIVDSGIRGCTIRRTIENPVASGHIYTTQDISRKFYNRLLRENADDLWQVKFCFRERKYVEYKL